MFACFGEIEKTVTPSVTAICLTALEFYLATTPEHADQQSGKAE